MSTIRYANRLQNNKSAQNLQSYHQTSRRQICVQRYLNNFERYP